jgi:hypothetical protein
MTRANIVRCGAKLLFIIGISGLSYGQFSREGPASGGGFQPAQPAPASGTEFSSSEFGKLDCRDNLVVVGKTQYYNCQGRWLAKQYVGGKVKYVEVPGPY